MKHINENTKVTLTFGQLKQLIRESIEDEVNPEEDELEVADDEEENVPDEDDDSPVVKLNKGTVFMIEDCPKQKALSWDYPGKVYVDTSINPKFDKGLPYVTIINQEGVWQLHFENFAKMDKGTSEQVIKNIFSAIQESTKSGFTLTLAGGATMGGLSGISKLAEYGFTKEFDDNIGNDSVYWGGDTIDPTKAENWFNSSKHKDEFWVKLKGGKQVLGSQYNGPVSIENTYPRGFKMIKN